jgi:hypothetical protein
MAETATNEPRASRTVIKDGKPSSRPSKLGPSTSKAKHTRFESETHGMENEHSDVEEQFKGFWLEEGKQLQDLLNEVMDRWMEEQSPA